MQQQLTDISFAVCDGANHGIEYFVPTGSHCEQGIVGKKVDKIVTGAATTTRTFFLQSYGVTVPPTATGRDGWS